MRRCLTKRKCSRDQEYAAIERQPSSYNALHTFDLAKGEEKQYQQQYGDMYFLRLAKLKPAVEELAGEAWGDIQVDASDIASGDCSIDIIPLR